MTTTKRLLLSATAVVTIVHHRHIGIGVIQAFSPGHDIIIPSQRSRPAIALTRSTGRIRIQHHHGLLLHNDKKSKRDSNGSNCIILSMANNNDNNNNNNNNNNDDNNRGDSDPANKSLETILPKLYTYQKPRQKRRLSKRKRKPRNYWSSIDNIRFELQLFWEEEFGVPNQQTQQLQLQQNQNQQKQNQTQQNKQNQTQHHTNLYHHALPPSPPPIPSEHILNYFRRNDLRWGIAQMGGRETVSHLLGGAMIIPGRWKDAVEMDIVKTYVLPRMQQSEMDKDGDGDGECDGDDSTVANEGCVVDKINGNCNYEAAKSEQTSDTKLISLVQHHSNSTLAHDYYLMDKPNTPKKEFWSKERAIQQLYIYLENYKKYKHRPSVWMPQLSELSHEGYSKLFNACGRFKKLPCVSLFSSSCVGNNNDDCSIETMAGLVPFKEWRYFESQLQLFVELKQYLQIYHHGSEEFFPEPSAISENGHKELSSLIQKHGGKLLLAQKLDMKLASSDIDNLSWGPLTLEFAIQLLSFIRSQFLLMSPPMLYPIICMPSEKDLIRCGQEDLANDVVRFGGYENVARRLGLAYFDGKSRRMEESIFRGAKILWKDRKSEATIGSSSSGAVTQSMKDRSRKAKGLAWNEDIVIEQLRAFAKANMTLPIYMPNFATFDDHGRGDLKNAISKFYGAEKVCDAAGLIPYKTHQSFERFVELLTELSKYRDRISIIHGDGLNCSNKGVVFPTSSRASSYQFDRLSVLIRQFGSKQRLEERFFGSIVRQEPSDFNYFVDVDSYLKLCLFIKRSLELKQPPVRTITMPTKDELIESNNMELVRWIESSGGYEEISEVLGIDFDKS